MRKILARFVFVILAVVWGVLFATVVVPALIWVISGVNYFDLMQYGIDWVEEVEQTNQF